MFFKCFFNNNFFRHYFHIMQTCSSLNQASHWVTFKHEPTLKRERFFPALVNFRPVLFESNRTDQTAVEQKYI